MYCPIALLHARVLEITIDLPIGFAINNIISLRVYHRCFLTLACVCVGGLEVGCISAGSWFALVTGVGGYVLAGSEIGVLSCIFSIFSGVRVVGVCVLVYARTHTQTTWVLDVSPGVAWRTRRIQID